LSAATVFNWPVSAWIIFASCQKNSLLLKSACQGLVRALKYFGLGILLMVGLKGFRSEVLTPCISVLFLADAHAGCVAD